ncbi:MAG TPA: hypothetical protein VM076_21805 [Gemmatimonadaceae bacterium]|nr:hypothetical protein [Gemmatimonadaceae bacterium]
MSESSDAEMPRWAGITEPMTVATNIVLAVLAFGFSARLGYYASAEGAKAAGAMAGGLMGTAFAAVLGAVAHGIDPRVDAALRQRMWRGALHAMGLIGVGSVMAVAFFAARGPVRTAILLFAAAKLVWYTVSVVRRPEFRVAGADYGGALAILLAGAVYAWARWREPGAPWLVAAVIVSLVAGVVQARRIGFHRHFNHNDVFHVIQIAALYLFYRGGLLLVDR